MSIIGADGTEIAGPYEQLLDRQFWDHSDDRRLVFLVGGVGSGKSTLMQYYFNSYCPNNPTNKHRFPQKLVITFDFKKNHEETFQSAFYTLLATDIRNRLQQHPNFIVPGLNEFSVEKSPEAYARHVLQHLNRIVQSPSGIDLAQLPFRYVVFVFDNLDQMAANYQKLAVLLITSWVDPKWQLLIWRVYIPLWPHTLEQLQSQLGMPFNRSSYSLIPLGSPPSNRIMSYKRDHIINKMYQSATPYVVVDDNDEGDDGETIIDRMISNSNSRDYVLHTFSFLERTFLEWAERLTAGDLRKQAQIWDNIISSRHSFRSWRSFRATQSRPIQSRQMLPYDLVDAALTGKFSVFKPADHPIANIYSPDGVSGNLILGSHFLMLFRNFAQKVNDQTMRELLTQIGHRDHDVDECLRFFFDINIFHQAPTLYEHYWMIRHTEAVSAYLELAVHPAYLDNVALISSVSDSVRDRITLTSAMVPSEFPQRVESTIAFIEQIRSDETDLLHSNSNLARIHRDRKTAANAAKVVRDPIVMESIWVRAALRYRERLVELKRRGYQFAGLKWQDLLDNPNCILQMALNQTTGTSKGAEVTFY
jgi:hypothetical protein